MHHNVSLKLMVVGSLSLLALAACEPRRSQPKPIPTAPTAAPAVRTDLPTRVSPPLAALPAAPATDARKVALGERLFHDNRLSVDGTLSCASCHNLLTGGTDSPRRSSLGVHNQEGPINSPTVFNAVFNFVQFWDGRARNLEEQAAGPVANPKEMGEAWPNVVAKLKGAPDYVAQFAAIYPDGITQNNVTNAIAEYERTLVTPSRFDRFAHGEVAALTDDEREGLALFNSTGCTGCHMGPNLGGTSFQKMGQVRDYFSARGGAVTEADLGRFNVTHQDADRHFFKVPTLRNVDLTPPYFHDGSAATLEQAITLMGRHQLGVEIPELNVRKIAAFLRSLTGERLPRPPAAVVPENRVEAAEAAAHPNAPASPTVGRQPPHPPANP